MSALLRILLSCVLIVLAGVAWDGGLGVDAAESPADTLPAVAYSARVIGDTERSRMIVDFDRKVTHRSYALDNPKRIIVDLSETVFALNPDAGQVPRSLVKDWRYGRVSAGSSRLVVNLTKAAKVENTILRARGEDGRQRLIVDLVSVSDDEFERIALKTPIAPETASRNREEQGNEHSYTIVIDPGHGGVDGGAIGPSKVREKEVTLGFAKHLAAELEKNPRFVVKKTRDADSFVSLNERLEIAKAAKADLLISIHADSLRQKHFRGATVYTLSKEGSDSISRMLARDQNRADLIAGLSLPSVEDDVGDILIDLTRRETKVFSRQFANILIRRLDGKVKMIRNPHRSADFFVLKSPEIPSVLLELGYLSNEEDEELLSSEPWQDMMAQELSAAIEAFFQPRLVGSK